MRRVFVLVPRVALVLVSAAVVAACGESVATSSTGPAISLTPQATTIKAGASTSLLLQTTSATSCVGTNGIIGPQPVNGTIVVPDIQETTTFSVTCTGPNGSSTAQTEVIVAGDAPTITLTAAATTIASGDQTTLTWSATDAQSCASSNGWSGTLATSGTQMTGPLTDTTDFTLLCTGPGGSAIQSVTVTVDSSAPVVQLEANPSTATVGSSVTLNYTVANATSCSASGGGWSTNPPLPSGSVSTAPISGTTIYTLTCTGPGGSASQSTTVSVNPSAPTLSINAGSSTIQSNTATTISWSSANSTGCTASGAWSGNEPVNGSISTGNLTHSETYILTCTGPGGSATQAATITVSAAAPAVSISANPSAVVAGNASTLTWSSSNTTSCTASGGWSGNLAASGTQSTGTLNASTTFTLTCTGTGGSASQSATVSVTQPLPTVSLTANPSTIANGASATLIWNSTHATSCMASGGWSGSEPTSGSTSTGNLTSNQSYTLTCTGPGGTAAQSATVTASAAAPTVSISANPSSITSGSASTLSWSATNATSCTASGGWSGNLAVSGTQSTGTLNASTTFTLTCTGTGGSASQSATVSVTQPVPTVSLNANPSTVASGNSSTLTWSSTNATSCSASGGWSGGEPTKGSAATGNLTSSQSFTLTCTGPGGTAAQTAVVTVSSPAPTVTLSAGPSAITSGSSSTLTWSATNATACTASGSWSGAMPVSGSQSTGALTSSATYTLTCTGSGGSASQSATVSVSSAAPTVAITANPSTIASGKSSTISWVTTNATACTGSGGGWSGSEPVNGSASTGALTSSTSYMLSCTGPGGNAAQSTTVTVTAANPVVTISANPSTVASGNTSTLTWSSTNTTSCTASNGWTGNEPTSGTQSTVALSATTKFVLTCTGPGGTAQNSTTVSVTVNPPSVSLTANPSSIASGGSSTLTWSSKNASSCAASGAFTGSLATSGSQLVTGITSNSTYTLTCTNSAGSNSVSATVTVPPTIGGSPATTATVGTPYSFTPTASGALGAILTFSIQHMPSWASFNTTNGALTGTPSAAGTFGNIIISVSDGITTVPLPAFSITVGTGGGGNPGSTCSASSGPLNLNAKVTRSNGVSPLMVFLDATGTTDSAVMANTTAFQDVTYSWNFGDTGASGTGNWPHGSNPGVSSKNSATGGIAAHLYITNGSDTNYTATVTATDGTNTASCQLAVTAYDPSGSNGFPGSATTCVSSSGTPVAGIGGCPAGANVSNQSNFGSALSNQLNGKRVLFKCGDTFTGNSATVKGQKFSVGAYGSCVGTTNGRPIFSANGGGGELQLGGGSSADFDGRFADLDLEGNNSANAFYAASNVYPYQITMFNIYSNGNQKSFYDYNASQMALVQFVMNGMGNYQGIYINNSENQCTNGSGAYNCGGSANYYNIDYQAILGSSFDGSGVTNNSNGIETVRISACRMCVIENNVFENANAVGAVLKLHNGNPNSQGSWIGQYTELVEISDNLFTGKSGAQLVEIAPQNSVTDERLRNIVFERNLVYGTSGGSGKVLASVQNGSFRDNAFNGINSGGSQYGLQMAKRGVEWTNTSGAPVNASEPQYDEAYNNTCYGSICIAFSGSDFQSPANSGWAKNNLMHSQSGGSTVSDSGSGNTVSNNTSNVSNDPGFANASGSFMFITDYTPSAFYSGGASAPVFFDALGAPWSPTWDLGALHP